CVSREHCPPPLGRKSPLPCVPHPAPLQFIISLYDSTGNVRFCARTTWSCRGVVRTRPDPCTALGGRDAVRERDTVAGRNFFYLASITRSQAAVDPAVLLRITAAVRNPLNVRWRRKPPDGCPRILLPRGCSGDARPWPR